MPSGAGCDVPRSRRDRSSSLEQYYACRSRRLAPSVRGVLRRCLSVLLLAALCSAGCSAPGTDRTDAAARLATGELEQHDTVLGYAHALVGFARAAGEEPAVLRLEEFGDDGRGTLVVRFEDPETTGVFSGREAVLACYRIDLEVAGPVGDPRRTTCPEGAMPLALPPDPARALPAGTAASVERLLSDLPARPKEAQVAAGIRRIFRDRSSYVLLEVRGTAVGVWVYVDGGNPCLHIVRRGGMVSTREQPPELGCSPPDTLTR